MCLVVRKASARSTSAATVSPGAWWRPCSTAGRCFSAGLAVMALQVLRECRLSSCPLGGLDRSRRAQIGLTVGLSSLVDAGVFYPVGYVMDRWGRKWAGSQVCSPCPWASSRLPLTHGSSATLSRPC